LIHGHFVGRRTCVVDVNLVNIVFEGVESVEEFICIITLVILLNPVGEEGFILFLFEDI